MRASAVSGLVFANANDKLLKKLTEKRSMASVPFGGRYRLIDFTLSNLVNAGITNVGLITTGNYRSLLDHVSNGIHWDLDRKNGGIHILAPYMSSDVRRFRGTVDALYAAIDFIDRCDSDYIVLCAADVLANVDIGDAIGQHVKNEADITVVYHNGLLPANRDDAMILEFDDNSVVTKLCFDNGNENTLNYGIGITIIGRKLLSDLVLDAVEKDLQNFNRDVLADKVNELKIMGYEHKEFITLMNGTATYYKAHMDLLDRNVRKELFNRERPIYTKIRDDMPTRYGIGSEVKNSLVSDGCVIDGVVKNSILGRGVKIEKGAVVENSILMQETTVKANATIESVIADKNVVITEGMVIKATPDRRIFINKNETV